MRVLWIVIAVIAILVISVAFFRPGVLYNRESSGYISPPHNGRCSLRIEQPNEKSISVQAFPCKYITAGDLSAVVAGCGELLFYSITKRGPVDGLVCPTCGDSAALPATCSVRVPMPPQAWTAR